MEHFPILSLLVFLPILGMIIILFIPKSEEKVIKSLTLLIAFVQVILAGMIWYYFDYSAVGVNHAQSYQFIEKFRWIELESFGWLGTIKIDYFLGIDGISAPMILLTALVTFIAVISSWNIKHSVKGYFALFLLLDTGMFGVFAALDFFLFYIFWELMLLPMYFLIGIWGGARREYAAIKFFIYTLLGSVFILLVMIGLYFSATETLATGEKVFTFNMIELMNSANYSADGILSPFNPENLRLIAYIALFIGFAIKIPMFPFHTWLPDAHVEAPTPISVILAGILLKMGGYGILRICYPIFPDVSLDLAWYIALFGMINIIYGAFCAMAQTDFKKLIAYSSVSHMGFVILGIAAFNTSGISGAVLQMFNHGTITALLFLGVGVLYDRTHVKGIYDFGNIANKMPIYTGFVTVAFFAAIGLPGLSGFISEALVFIGAFGFAEIRTLTIISASGLILGAGYMLWTFQRVYLGKENKTWEELPDFSMREYLMFVPLTLVVIILGIYPSFMLDIMNTSVVQLVEVINKSFTGIVN